MSVAPSKSRNAAAAVSTPRIKRFAPWHGANTAMAERVGIELGKLAWCGVPFASGCSELPCIDTRCGVAADLHLDLVNMARVVADAALKAKLMEMLEGVIFHPCELHAAQRRCAHNNMQRISGLFQTVASSVPDLRWARDYFIACWMSRGGNAGKATEFTQGHAVRWSSGGGGSTVRFRSAIESLEAWHRVLLRWDFVVEDCFEFLRRVHDQPNHGLYLDPPWPDLGAEYKHKFDYSQQYRLKDVLDSFKHSRIVLRYNDHPLVRELYPEGRWTWIRNTSRNQSNNDVSEVLIINGPSYMEAAA